MLLKYQNLAMVNDILFQLPEIYNKGKPFVLCLVIGTVGSTPRKVGARMVVFSDGTAVGTIGGGTLELRVIQEAKNVLEYAKITRKEFRLEEDTLMECGGSIEVYFEPYFRALRLFVFGAGHVGREVGRFAKEFGFKVHFIDHRPGIFDQFDNLYAECIVSDYVPSLSLFQFNDCDFAVITTPSHEYDELLLRHLAREKLAYLGMMGSKRKTESIKHRLLSENALTAEQINKVDMPIGIPIRAETPSEIAMSIVAKLIDVKNTLFAVH